MPAKFPRQSFLIAALLIGSGLASATEPPAVGSELHLSPEVLELLRSEMREISVGVQAVALAIATADWASIQDQSVKIRASYILEQSLTPAQAEELQQGLPAAFKQLDARFHQRAALLGAAAQAHDAELVTFHYARLLESCTACHADYAKSRFPGFSSKPQEEHHH